jgi:transcriptional regulator with XRE-family HTH domain
MSARPKLADVLRARIRALRAARGLTQEQLCERADLSLDAISRIEGGSRAPTLDTLKRIADGLGVPLEDLIRSDPPPKAATPEALSRLVALLEGEPELSKKLSRKSPGLSCGS